MGTRFAAIGLTLLFVISTLSGCIGNEDSDVENTENYFDEYSELQLEIADLRVNNTLLKNGKDDLTQQNALLQDQINQLTLELSTVSSEIVNKTNEIEDLSNQLDNSEDNDTLLSNQIVQLQMDIYDLNQEKNDLLIALSENSTTQQNLELQITTLNSTIVDIQNQLQQSISNANNLSSKMDNQISRLIHTPTAEQIVSCPESHPPNSIFQTGFDDGTGDGVANDGILQSSEIVDELYECGYRLDDQVVVKDINPNGDSDPENLFSYQGRVLFSADDGTHGRELWISDGSISGTQMLKNINPGAGDSNPEDFTLHDGLVYFSAFNQSTGTEIWVTDGTSLGTSLLYDIWPGVSSGYVDYLTSLNGNLYFAGNDGINGNEPWFSDGSSTTYMIKNVNTDFDLDTSIGNSSISSGSYTDVFHYFDSKVYFTAFTSTYGAEPWVTDGTEENTSIFIDVFPGHDSSQTLLRSTPAFIGGQDRMLFNANYTLWSTNGTVQDTIELDSSNYFGDFVIFQGGFYYLTQDELFKTDGSVAGTEMIYSVQSDCYNPNTQYQYDSMNGLTVVGNSLIFAANAGYTGLRSSGPYYELFLSDGTTQGTQSIDLYTTSSGSSSAPVSYHCSRQSSFPYAFNTLSENTVYFSTKNLYDGSSKTTRIYGEISKSFYTEEIEFALVNDMLFLTKQGELHFVVV